ncbi:hypothetical protein BDK51DRAFT_43975 [Blyttiomyces helicus]|uniref:Uncharacterized protein n=1 Tax=Blyttiomyces helicus TaxID=388810 RepID=A0A4P9WCF7_9FUNG|nr:hypothetical protein BDK51DRAFT_43975 [Blyttiomyces helicus]|eukprot:RKO90002.1 hypothetical protein BDK51DRAFT_43975 [Blyttiomyces helicus]
MPGKGPISLMLGDEVGRKTLLFFAFFGAVGLAYRLMRLFLYGETVNGGGVKYEDDLLSPVEVSTAPCGPLPRRVSLPRSNSTRSPSRERTSFGWTPRAPHEDEGSYFILTACRLTAASPKGKARQGKQSQLQHPWPSPPPPPPSLQPVQSNIPRKRTDYSMSRQDQQPSPGPADRRPLGPREPRPSAASSPLSQFMPLPPSVSASDSRLSVASSAYPAPQPLGPGTSRQETSFSEDLDSSSRSLLQVGGKLVRLRGSVVSGAWVGGVEGESGERPSGNGAVGKFGPTPGTCSN